MTSMLPPQAPVIPTLLREFLPETLRNFKYAEWQRLESSEREKLVETIVSEVRRALPHIRQRIGNQLLPTPPPGTHIYELELDVRTHNCLISLDVQDNLQLLGQLTINNLLAVRNFGVKSLVNLLVSLQMVGSEIPPIDLPQTEPSADTTVVVDHRSYITCDDVQTVREFYASESQIPYNVRQLCIPKLPLGLRLDKLNLKNRTYNCLQKAGYIDDPQLLCGQPVDALLELPAFGKESLVDLLTLLEPFFTGNEDYTRTNGQSVNLAREARLLYDTDFSELITSDDPRLGYLLQQISPHSKNAKEAAEGFLDGISTSADAEALALNIREFRLQLASLSNMSLEEELSSFLATYANQRNAEIFSRRLGLDGQNGVRLQQLADEYGMTRERIRQVCERINSRFEGRRSFAPAVDRALAVISNSVPCLATDIESTLQNEAITEKGFRLESLLNAAKLLNRDVLVSVTSVGRERVALAANSEDLPDQILSVVRRSVEHWGAVTIEDMSVRAAEQSGLPSKLVTQVISAQKDFRWLHEEDGWFWLTTVARNRLINQIEKILSVTEAIDIRELRDGIRRHHRMEGFAPPQHVLLELCRQLSWCRVDNNMVIAVETENWREILSENERVMVEILKASGSVMRREQLENESVSRGMNRTTFYAYLNYSPVITKHCRGVYGLRGVPLSSEMRESLQSTSSRTKVLCDHGQTAEGKPWVGYQLSDNSILTGVISIPRSLTSAVGGEFKLLSSDGSFVGTLATNDISAWGLKPVFRRKGVEAGDYLVVVFDFESRTAELRFGDEELLDGFCDPFKDESEQISEGRNLALSELQTSPLDSVEEIVETGDTTFGKDESVPQLASVTEYRNSIFAIKDDVGLRELEFKWRNFFQSEACPPVPGLAPLSDEESKLITDLVVRHSKRPEFQWPPWRILFSLLQTYPSTISIWLARKAGEAYESGAFWEKFCELVGISIPMPQREELAKRFRQATWSTMTNWLPPTELGGHNIVSQFLHQAGLPLDRCAGFAQLVRKVERSYGLPDVQSPDAGEQLREIILEDLIAYPVPTLRRALQGPAGPSICELALDVVLKGDYSGVNPRLGKELEYIFRDTERTSLRKSAALPFLRLSADLTSLELVGPKQDLSLISERGLTWIVDGRRYPTPRTEEFVAIVTDKTRAIVELTGLRNGNLPPRPFAIRLDDLPSPFILFDAQTRKQRRSTDSIPPGDYFLLHRAADSLRGAQETYPWPDNERSLSSFSLLPGTSIDLQHDGHPLWSFKASLTPFFQMGGEKIEDDSGESIHFGWHQVPYVWFPTDDVLANQISHWKVELEHDSTLYQWSLTSSAEQNLGSTKCIVQAGQFLEELKPGLHHLEFRLRRGESIRVHTKADCWFWRGLKSYDRHRFQLQMYPHNLLQSECRGFSSTSNVIQHETDRHRHHKLAFLVAGTQKSLFWSRPGLFVESFDRTIGQTSKPRLDELGDAYAASLDSVRWLRIWLAGQTDWQLYVAGRLWLKSIPNDKREFVDVSLASLAVAVPHGGNITLVSGGTEVLIARFTSPVHPVAVDQVEDHSHRGLRFEFPETIEWIRPVVRDLASGNQYSYQGLQITDLDELCFEENDLPAIKCVRIVSPHASDRKGPCSLTLFVPRSGWPEGYWMTEFDTRRDEHSEWQRAVLHGDLYCPVTIISKLSQRNNEVRTQLFWNAYEGKSFESLEGADEEDQFELFRLLSDLIELQIQRFASSVQRQMEWLKPAVRSLSKASGEVAGLSDGNRLQINLLNLACQDPAHAGFVYLPNLLALPGDWYRNLPSGDPLNDALRICGTIATANSIVDVVRSDFDLFSVDALGCFANFNELAQISDDPTPTVDLDQFDYRRYWQEVLGTLRAERLNADWSGQSLLGKTHLVWALQEFVGRYERAGQNSNLGAANALLRSASHFRSWLQAQLSSRSIMPSSVWLAPWPSFVAQDTDLLESTPRFASLFALAARAAAAGWLNFNDAIAWLQQRVNRRMAEDGIAALVGLAPELFGYQLLFWELIVRTMKNRVSTSWR